MELLVLIAALCSLAHGSLVSREKRGLAEFRNSDSLMTESGLSPSVESVAAKKAGLLRILNAVSDVFANETLLSSDYYRKNVDLTSILQDEQATLEKLFQDNSSKEGAASCRDAYARHMANLQVHLETFYVKSVKAQLDSITPYALGLKKKLATVHPNTKDLQAIASEVAGVKKKVENIQSLVLKLGLSKPTVTRQFKKLVGIPMADCLSNL